MTNLGLCIFSTTKGNFHQTDIYKAVVEDLFNQLPEDFFAQKLAHVKDGGESSAIDMANVYAQYGISTVFSQGKYKHFDPSHASEYEKDVHTMAQRLDQTFTFFLEADWLLRVTKGNPAQLRWYFEKAVDFLTENPNVACMRFPHELYDEEIFKSQPYEALGTKLHVNQHFYSLNPHIIRTSYLQKVCQFMTEQGDKLTPHIEWRFTQAFQIMTNNAIWFGAFDPLDVRARHIGLPDWQKVRTDIEKEYD